MPDQFERQKNNYTIIQRLIQSIHFQPILHMFAFFSIEHDCQIWYFFKVGMTKIIYALCPMDNIATLVA